MSTTAWMQDAYTDVGGRECLEHILEEARSDNLREIDTIHELTITIIMRVKK